MSLRKRAQAPSRALRLIAMALIAAGASGAGCAGSRSAISARSVSYPVSLSPAIRDVDGSVLTAAVLVKVGTFKYEYATMSMLWTLIPLSRHGQDLSTALTEQIRANSGEAVINLRITNTGDSGIEFKAFLTL